MSDSERLRSKVLKACSEGNVPTLTMLLKRPHGHSDEPDWKTYSDCHPWISILLKERIPSVWTMLRHAARSGRSETVAFLHSEFPGCSRDSAPLASAIESGDVETVRTVLRLWPDSANTPPGTHILDACYRFKGDAAAEVIKILLDDGADPNAVPARSHAEMFPWNTCAAQVSWQGLPAVIIEYLFDAGWVCDNSYAIRTAVTFKRFDMLKIMFVRGSRQREAYFPPQADLIREAGDDKAMVRFIRRNYPACFRRRVENVQQSSTLKKVQKGSKKNRSWQRKNLFATLIKRVRDLRIRLVSTRKGSLTSSVDKKLDALSDVSADDGTTS